MALDTNEKRLVEKLATVLDLLDASKKDRDTIVNAKKIDANFLKKAGNIFDKTEACNVCSHAFHSWRRTMDDETLLSFIDDWINWKTKNDNAESTSAISKK